MALPIGFAQNRGSFHNLGRTDKTSLYPPSLSFRSSIPVFYIFLPFVPFLHLEVGSLNPARGSKERYKQKLGSVLSFLRDFVPFSINSYQMPISFQTAWRRGGIRSENRDGSSVNMPLVPQFLTDFKDKRGRGHMTHITMLTHPGKFQEIQRPLF